MINLLAIRNPELITKAFLRDDIYKPIKFSDTWSDKFVLPHAFYYLILEEKETKGILELVQESPTSISFHGGVYKEHRGDSARYLSEILRQLREYLPKHTFWTKIDETNTPAIKMVESINCEQVGKIEGANYENAWLLYRWKDV